MKVIYTILAGSIAPSVYAHTGDHSALTSSLTHAFSSFEHLAAALCVLGAVAGLVALGIKMSAKLKVSRAK